MTGCRCAFLNLKDSSGSSSALVFSKSWIFEKMVSSFVRMVTFELKVLGKSTRDVSANDLMWEFFERHPMK